MYHEMMHGQVMGLSYKPNINVSCSTSELRVRLRRETDLSPPVNISLTVPRRCFFCGSFLLVMLHVGVCCAVVSIPRNLVVACWEMADLLAVVYVVFSCVLSLSQMCSCPHQN